MGGDLVCPPGWTPNDRLGTARLPGFVEAMWDAEEGKFWTGTAADGLTINKTVIPLDVQAWAVLRPGSPQDGRRRRQ